MGRTLYERNLHVRQSLERFERNLQDSDPWAAAHFKADHFGRAEVPTANPDKAFRFSVYLAANPVQFLEGLPTGKIAPNPRSRSSSFRKW